MRVRCVWVQCGLSLFICLLSSHGVLAQATTSTGKAGFELWMPALAALVGGLISGVVGPFLKDVVIQRWNEERSDRKLRGQIEQSYFAPLSAAAEKLTWRMAEILLDQRPHFLMLKARPIAYNHYKRVSTLYRIAALLGWIRALNLELSALPRGGFGGTSPVFKALAQVQSAMADGHNVEKTRVKSFCSACNIDLVNISDDQFASLAANFEVAMYAIVGDEIKESHRHLVGASDLQQEFICRGLLRFLTDKGLGHSLNDEMFRAALPNMVGSLGYRESLIYREWQEAIGDVVIVKDQYSIARQYRIIGFEEFERLITSEKFSWIGPLREFIEDVDFEVTDSTDERHKHVRDLAKGVAAVLSAISESSQGALVNSAALKQAKRIQALP